MFHSNQQFVAMVCDPIMLTLALLWLYAVGYKDNINNAKELFKSTLVDEAMRSFRPPKPNMTPNVLPNDDNINV